MKALAVAALLLAWATPTFAEATVARQKDATAAAAGLASADPAARTRAACELRELGSGAAPVLGRLVAMLDDGSPVDAAVCGNRTWRHRGVGAEDATSPGEQAASALVAIGTPAYEPLKRTLGGPAWIARKNAAWALGAIGNTEAVTALIEALKDTDAGVREQVAWALGAIGDRRAVDGLIGALNDTAAGVRKQAAWALGALGDSRAVTALTKTLKDPDAGVRRQSAWALGSIGR